MMNRYLPHLLVLPEDDANRQIANGFLLTSELNRHTIQVLPEARGWGNVVDKFANDYASTMRRYPNRMMTLLIDFDRDETRFNYVVQRTPDDLRNRVFVLGVLSEPEELRSNIRSNLEEIGATLASDCSNVNGLWGHELLRHNRMELDRMVLMVRPFLFNNASSD